MSAIQSFDPNSIAGFWRRIAAFALDALALGLIGITLGAIFEEQLVSLGPWGRLLGFLIALAYFGPLNSRLAGGQTLGKRLLQIKVVDAQGAPLALGRSLLRFLPLGSVWFLNNAQLPDGVLFSAWAAVFGLAILGLGASTLYLYVFNRRSRQSLHDWLVGSFVVNAASQGALAAEIAGPPPKLHRVVCALLLALGGLAPLISQQFQQQEPFAQLGHILHAVNAETWVVSSGVNQGATYTSSSSAGSKTTRHLSINAVSRDADIDNAERAQKLATLALAAHPAAGQLDLIQITIVHGYDIGIASAWRSHSTARAPAKWLAP